MVEVTNGSELWGGLCLGSGLLSLPGVEEGQVGWVGEDRDTEPTFSAGLKHPLCHVLLTYHVCDLESQGSNSYRPPHYEIAFVGGHSWWTAAVGGHAGFFFFFFFNPSVGG